MKIFILIIAISINLLSFDLKANESKLKLGVDILEYNTYDFINDKECILLTNFAGRNSEGALTVEVLKKNPHFKLIALLTPEHGFYTTVPAGEHVSNDVICDLPAYSLYNKSRQPPDDLMEKIDVVLIDLQDIGVRSYTYLSTMYKTLEAASKASKTVVLLDRPNPLGGLTVDGNLPDSGVSSFVGIIPIPYIHGMTFGEIAKMINDEGWLKNDQGETIHCDLKIIKMDGWRRDMTWEDTGLKWYPTSPHIPTVDAARGYATFGFIGELGLLSIGIGTTFPFQVIGRTDFNFDENSIFLSIENFHSFTYSKLSYYPFYGMYKNEKVNGYYFDFKFSSESKPYRDGLKFCLSLKKANPKLFDKIGLKEQSINMFKKVTGTSDIFDNLFNTDNSVKLLDIAERGIDDFKLLRNKYLLY